MKKLGPFLCTATAFSLPISTSLTHVFFFSTVLYSLFTHGWYAAITMISKNPVAKIMALVYALFLVGVLYSHAPLYDILHTLSEYDKIPLAILLFPLFTDHTHREWGLYGFLAAMLLTLVLAYLKSAGVPLAFAHPGEGAIFKSYLTTNLFMAFAVFVFATLMLPRKTYRTLTYGLIALGIYNITHINQGRSGYVVFAALTLLFLWRQYRWKGLEISFAFLLLLGTMAYFTSPVFKDRILRIPAEITHYQHGFIETSVGLRIEFAKNSLQLLHAHPWIGTGTGSFSHSYANLSPEPKILTHNPHNEYLNFGVQFGLLGIILLIYLFWTQWRTSALLPEFYPALGQALVLAMSLGCLANSWIMDTSEGHFYVFFTALIFGSFSESRRYSLDKLIAHIKTFKSRIFYHRSHFTAEMDHFFKSPEFFFETRVEHYFKNKPQDTTTVALLRIGSRAYVVKRYNIKNFWHAVKRAFLPSRAMVSWKNAHQLGVLGIPTAPPVAVLEKRFGPLKGTAYFVSEYVHGMQASEYFSTCTTLSAETQTFIQRTVALIQKLKTAFLRHDDLHHFNLLIADHQPILLDLDHMKKYRFLRWLFPYAHRKDLAQFFHYLSPHPIIFNEFNRVWAQTRK